MKYNELVGKYKSVALDSIPAREFEIRKAVLTSAEIEKIPEETAMFKSAGKAFFKTDKAEVLEKIEAHKKLTEERLETLLKTKATLADAIDKIEKHQAQLQSRLAPAQQ